MADLAAMRRAARTHERHGRVEDALELEKAIAALTLHEIGEVVRKPNGVVTREWYYDAVKRVRRLVSEASAGQPGSGA